MCVCVFVRVYLYVRVLATNHTLETVIPHARGQCVAACCSVLQRVAACCNVLQCVAVCCNVLQCVATCSRLCCMTLSLSLTLSLASALSLSRERERARFSNSLSSARALSFSRARSLSLTYTLSISIYIYIYIYIYTYFNIVHAHMLAACMFRFAVRVSIQNVINHEMWFYMFLNILARTPLTWWCTMIVWGGYDSWAPLNYWSLLQNTGLFCRALLQKRPTTLRRLLTIVQT